MKNICIFLFAILYWISPLASKAQSFQSTLPIGKKSASLVVPGGLIKVGASGGLTLFPVLSNEPIDSVHSIWSQGEQPWYDFTHYKDELWKMRYNSWQGTTSRNGKLVFCMQSGVQKEVPVLQTAAQNAEQTKSRSLNATWKFHLGDLSQAQVSNFDDSSWENVNLPHDWAFEHGYSIDGAQKDKGGYACGGVGWYRKELFLTVQEQKAHQLYLDFDAVYRNAEVWINGHSLGKCPYGYLSFSREITPYLQEGKNVIAVRVDNALEPSARWYHGCGIYGNVYVRAEHAVGFEHNATFVSMIKTNGILRVETSLKNAGLQSGLTLLAELSDTRGDVQAKSERALSANATQKTVMVLKATQPKLWSPESPELYKLTLKILDANQEVLDHQQINVGFRDFEWSPQKGFLLNGRQYKLRGVCEHLEGGPTGAIYTPQLMRWKLQLLKDMGCNAIRTAHNPQFPYFYDLCDEMGILVMDEVFDGWKKKADHDYGRYDFAQHWEEDLRALVRRDRNHPSVFVYSVGNETQGTMAADLVRVCREEDPTRLVTSGSSGSNAMNINGVNGGSETESFINSYVPGNKAFVGTENPHTWQVRGYYRTKTWYRDGYKNGNLLIPDLTEKEIFTYDWTSPDKKRNPKKQIFNSSYDNATVRVCARRMIEVLRDKEWFSGSFRWTGFDYLGEAGYVHGGWPFRAFQSGALDLAGFPKDLYYLYQSEWSDKDMVHILPHWSHPMMALGTEIPVWVYTSGDEVELKLNGKSLGRKQKGKAWNEMQCEFLVPWTPGTVEAIAYRDGKEIARTSQTTAEAPSRLGVAIENNQLKADGQDISILTLREEDSNGTLYPYGENRIYARLNGPARVLSFENGSPVDVETNFAATSRCCFFGLNRIFVQSTGGVESDPVSVVLASIQGDKKLKQSDKVTITCNEIALRGALPQRDLQIYYTTDGKEPTRQSEKYVGAFALSPGKIVKAAVYDGTELILKMEEKFGPNEGLYWGKTDGVGPETSGEQAEHLELTDCKVVRGGYGAEGRAYVVPVAGKGKLAWYQENDGATMKATLTIRYSQASPGRTYQMDLYNNNKLVGNVQFANTGSVDANWKEITVPLTIYSGANNICLKSVSRNGAPSIDKIKVD